jgi:ornithine carbamoyltransferase
MTRHFLDLSDFSGADLRRVLDASAAIKAKRRKGEIAAERPLAGKTLAMVFRQALDPHPGLLRRGHARARAGETLMLTGSEMQLGRGETIADTARVLSRYVDAIMIRTLDHAMVTELAQYASIPVINGLTKMTHPCQIMADVMTFEEHRGPIKGRTIAWTGDANNVLASWVHAAAKLEFRLKIASPPELAPRPELLSWAKKEGAEIVVTTDAFEAAEGAHAVVTDCWVSMGDEDEFRRHNLLKSYQVNAKLMGVADRDALFMHCLPAHRGEEVTDEVMDGPQSVVFDEAENRLHAQKGILAWCLGATGA